MSRVVSAAQIWHEIQSTLPKKTAATLIVRNNNAHDHKLAQLLCEPNNPPLTILSPPSEVMRLRHLRAKVRVIKPDRRNDVNNLQAHGRWAIENDVKHLIVPISHSDVANCSHSHLQMSGNGLEMLPKDVLEIDTPLLRLPYSAPALHGAPPCASTLRYAARKREMLSCIARQSEDLLRRSILCASHWGHIVLTRRPLIWAYESGRAGRQICHEALSRVMMHVSGADVPCGIEDAQVVKLAKCILKKDEKDGIPKGRTAGGAIFRPVSGRFGRDIRARAKGIVSQHDLLLVTREPDQEKNGLIATRLRGNFACAGLLEGGDGVYWDNRFVIMADAHVANGEMIDEKKIYLATLKEHMQVEEKKEDMMNCEMYIRQLRRGDWEQVADICNTIRKLPLPFHCIRALPGVFAKQKGNLQPGNIVASPHLGLSSSKHLSFVAIRMPRFRVLPHEIEPGFKSTQ